MFMPVSCDRLEGCPFFQGQMRGISSVAEHYKTEFCHGKFQDCARFMVFQKLGKEKVPADLYPNEKERAFGLILTKGK
jgi:methyl-accepting chemotaxis protein